jgi:hypothetical protein
MVGEFLHPMQIHTVHVCRIILYVCVYIYNQKYLYIHIICIYIHIYIDIYIQPEIAMKGRARVSNRTKKMLCLLHSDQAFFSSLGWSNSHFCMAHPHVCLSKPHCCSWKPHFVGLIQLLAGCSLNVRFCRPIMPIRRLIPNLHWWNPHLLSWHIHTFSCLGPHVCCWNQEFGNIFWFIPQVWYLNPTF